MTSRAEQRRRDAFQAALELMKPKLLAGWRVGERVRVVGELCVNRKRICTVEAVGAKTLLVKPVGSKWAEQVVPQDVEKVTFADVESEV